MHVHPHAALIHLGLFIKTYHHVGAACIIAGFVFGETTFVGRNRWYWTVMALVVPWVTLISYLIETNRKRWLWLWIPLGFIISAVAADPFSTG